MSSDSSPDPHPQRQSSAAEPSTGDVAPAKAESHARAIAAIHAATGQPPVEIPRLLARARVIEHYRECWQARLWNGHSARSRALHVGLYCGADDDPEDAQLRLDEHLADLAGLGAGPARLLDAGCGIGGTAIHLARRHPGLRVTGLDLCAEFVRLGQQLADEAELRNRVLLVSGDYVETGLRAASFDVVLAIDSLGHCDDRPAFAREAFRLLAPGGRLVVSDFAHSGRPLNMLEASCYESVLEGLVLADCFAQPPDELFGAAGFVEPWLEDLTARALPGLARAGDRASTLLQNVRLPPPRRGHEQGCVALHALCQTGALRYVAFRARKPGGDRP